MHCKLPSKDSMKNASAYNAAAKPHSKAKRMCLKIITYRLHSSEERKHKGEQR